MTPEDDLTIEPETSLYHRVPDNEDHIVDDQNRGCRRLSSAAFIGKYEMSVVLGDRLAELDREPADALGDYPGQFLARFSAVMVRELDQIVVRSPLDIEPAHGDVIGKKTRSVARALARQACWIVAPPSACAEDMC
jgi:hypothetical protein